MKKYSFIEESYNLQEGLWDDIKSTVSKNVANFKKTKLARKARLAWNGLVKGRKQEKEQNGSKYDGAHKFISTADTIQGVWDTLKHKPLSSHIKREIGNTAKHGAVETAAAINGFRKRYAKAAMLRKQRRQRDEAAKQN